MVMGGGSRHSGGLGSPNGRGGSGASTTWLLLLLLVIVSCTVFLCFVNSGESAEEASSRRFLVSADGEPGQGRRYSKAATMGARAMAMQQQTRSRQKVALQRSGDSEAPIPFMLVTAERPTGCQTMEGSHMLMKSYKNKVDYCSLHGCKVWYSLEVWDESMPGTWARYRLLKKLMLSFPDIPWFMWMDGDAIFTDMGFQIPFRDYDEWGKRMVFHGFEDKVYGDSPDWAGINAGVFLMKNCDFTLAFFDRWIEMGDPAREPAVRAKLNAELPSRPKGWPADDQSALVYLLRENKLVTDRNRTQDDFFRVYLELRYYLHGYWQILVDKYEKWEAQGNLPDSGKEEDVWPFVTHFVGCKICSGEYATTSSRACSKQFDRAYGFADQQLLALAGMEHPHLATHRVQPIKGSYFL